MDKRNRNLLIQNSKGFSLIEILISLALLAMAGTFVGGKIYQSYQEGLTNSAKIQMSNLADRLKEYRRHCHSYPTTEQGLEALVTKPSGGRECKRYAPGGYIEGGEVPRDPWDSDFMYESDGKTFNIWSLGADGMEGGEEGDADVYLKGKKQAE